MHLLSWGTTEPSTGVAEVEPGGDWSEKERRKKSTIGYNMFESGHPASLAGLYGGGRGGDRHTGVQYKVM